MQGSRIRIIRILFFEKYARILTYSIFSYVNKNKIRNYVFENGNYFELQTPETMNTKISMNESKFVELNAQACVQV